MSVMSTGTITRSQRRQFTQVDVQLEQASINASANSARPAKGGSNAIGDSIVKHAAGDAALMNNKTPKSRDKEEESSGLSDTPATPPPAATKSRTRKARLSVHVDTKARAKVFDGREAPDVVLTEETQVVALESEVAGLKPKSKSKRKKGDAAVEEEEEEPVAPKKKGGRPKKAAAEPADPDTDAKPRRKASRKKTAASDDNASDADDEPAAAKKNPTRTNKAAATVPEEPVEEEEEEEEEESKPKRKASKKKKKASAAEDDADESPSPKKQRAARSKKATTTANRTKKRAAPTPDSDDASSVGEDKKTIASPARKRRRTKNDAPIVYEIPDIEKRETTFKGRLGYACLNTILRAQKPDSIFCSRTCRIASINEKGASILFELGLQNIKDLHKMIEWNEKHKSVESLFFCEIVCELASGLKHGIRFMRMSSDMFPFASHPKYGYDLSFADKDLKACGDLAKKYGHRLTTHPGQFTQLGSPRPEVVDAAVRDLTYHCEMIDRMGLDQDSVMIIHMGGVFGDKAATIARFKDVYTTRLSDSIKARVVLENDEICYNLDDIMPVCDELDIPIVVDYHHDWIYPSTRPLSVLIPLLNLTWLKKRIKPKQHLSEPRPGATTPMEKRAHADRCNAGGLPKELDQADVGEVDLMIEAKDKEQAVFDLYRMYTLEDTIQESLRPPKRAEEMTLATNGRKSNNAVAKRKAKAKAEEEERED